MKHPTITWLYPNNRQYTQPFVLSKCKEKDKHTMNSAVYEAIENGSYFIDLGYGVHHFRVNL